MKASDASKVDERRGPSSQLTDSQNRRAGAEGASEEMQRDEGSAEECEASPEKSAPKRSDIAAGTDEQSGVIA